MMMTLTKTCEHTQHTENQKKKNKKGGPFQKKKTYIDEKKTTCLKLGGGPSRMCVGRKRKKEHFCVEGSRRRELAERGGL